MRDHFENDNAMKILILHLYNRKIYTAKYVL